MTWPFRVVLAALAPLCSCSPTSSAEAPYRLEKAIALPGVEGRIDHLALEPGGKRLVVAARGNDSVEVVDLEQGRVVHRITGVREPQGVLFLADGRLAVTSGGDGQLHLYAAGTWVEAGRVDLGGDADNLRAVPGTKRIAVGHGAGGIAFLEPGVEGVKDLGVGAHPEAFQLEAQGTRVFVNVPGAAHVAVLDRSTSRSIATWPLGDARANFPMALDEAAKRLFVGCRSPARLLVLDTTDGRQVASVEIDEDVDDLWLDGARVHVTCGGGALNLVEQDAEGTWRRTARLPTAAGARTSLFDAVTRRLYVAVPHRGAQSAEVRVYAVGP